MRSQLSKHGSTWILYNNPTHTIHREAEHSASRSTGKNLASSFTHTCPYIANQAYAPRFAD